MDKNGHVPNQTIKVGKQDMDGRTLLNYARFRKDDEGDYGRTKRQQQVMQAVMKQLKNPLSLFKGPEALGKVYSLTSTNMSMTDMLDLGLSNAEVSKKVSIRKPFLRMVIGLTAMICMAVKELKLILTLIRQN